MPANSKRKCSNSNDKEQSKSKSKSKSKLVSDKYSCEFCGKPSTTISNRRSHIWNVHNKGSYQCKKKTCLKRFRYKKKLDSHKCGVAKVDVKKEKKNVNIRPVALIQTLGVFNENQQENNNYNNNNNIAPISFSTNNNYSRSNSISSQSTQSLPILLPDVFNINNISSNESLMRHAPPCINDNNNNNNNNNVSNKRKRCRPINIIDLCDDSNNMNKHPQKKRKFDDCIGSINNVDDVMRWLRSIGIGQYCNEQLKIKLNKSEINNKQTLKSIITSIEKLTDRMGFIALKFGIESWPDQRKLLEEIEKLTDRMGFIALKFGIDSWPDQRKLLEEIEKL